MPRTENQVNRQVLQSWQEIAQYMGRGLRSVQRWERQFGLPIHRNPGRKRRQVFAFTDELQLWLRSTLSSGAGLEQERNVSGTGSTTGIKAPRFLNSWKEVAHFVGFGMRTVQRWERRSGFPVHRPAGKMGSPIVGLPEEIEHWLNSSPAYVRERLAMQQEKRMGQSAA